MIKSTIIRNSLFFVLFSLFLPVFSYAWVSMPCPTDGTNGLDCQYPDQAFIDIDNLQYDKHDIMPYQYNPVFQGIGRRTLGDGSDLFSPINWGVSSDSYQVEFHLAESDLFSLPLYNQINIKGDFSISYIGSGGCIFGGSNFYSYCSIEYNQGEGAVRIWNGIDDYEDVYFDDVSDQHFVFTFEKRSAGYYVKIYSNGFYDGGGQTSVKSIMPFLALTSFPPNGAVWPDNFNYTYSFDELVVFNYALSPVEVASIYSNLGIVDDTAKGLIANWHFNGNLEDTAENNEVLLTQDSGNLYFGLAIIMVLMFMVAIGFVFNHTKYNKKYGK